MEKASKGLFKSLLQKLKASTNRRKYEKDGDNAEFIHLQFIDLCIYLIFLIATTICIYPFDATRTFSFIDQSFLSVTMSTREISMSYFEQIIERLFVNRHTYNEQGFEFTVHDLVTVDDWWFFSQKTFLQGIAQFGTKNGTYKLAIESNVFLGVPRLRQIRVRNETCTIHDAFRKQFRTCYGKYSKENEDVSGFFNKTHLTRSEINSYTIRGIIASYYGGGYIEYLSLDPDENEGILERLKDASWIDRGTRLIVIEFALFNPNVNLFCNVKLLSEILPSGGILTSVKIQPLKYFALCRGYFECMCTSIFYGFILYHTLEIVSTITAIGFVSFCRSIWNILDFFVMLVGYLSVFYIIWHTIYLRRILHNDAFKNAHISLDVICYWNMAFLTLMGILVFIVWIKIFKYIKLNKTILQFSSTLRRCAKDLLGFALMFAIVFIAYADLSVLLFGTVHPYFRDFPTAVLSMIRMVLGDFDYAEIEESSQYLAPIYFLSYVLFVFFILLNMFLAIINDTYSDVKSEITQGKGNNFEDYIVALFKKLKNYVIRAKKDATSLEGLDESSESPERRTDEMDLTKPNSSNKHFMDSWFEVIPITRTQEEENALKQRIELLEQLLEKLVQYLEEILNKMNSNQDQPSTRSI